MWNDARSAAVLRGRHPQFVQNRSSQGSVFWCWMEDMQARLKPRLLSGAFMELP